MKRWIILAIVAFFTELLLLLLEQKLHFKRAFLARLHGNVLVYITAMVILAVAFFVFALDMSGNLSVSWVFLGILLGGFWFLFQKT